MPTMLAPPPLPPIKKRGGIRGSYTLLSFLLGNSFPSDFYLTTTITCCQMIPGVNSTFLGPCQLFAWSGTDQSPPFANCFLLMVKSHSGFGFPSRKRFSFFFSSSSLSTSHSVTGDAAIFVAAFEGKDELPLRKRRACSACM